jgi:hypothetical protein
MRSKLVLLGLLAAGVLSGSAAAVPAGWRDAIAVPGMTTLDVTGYSIVNSVSCPTASVCVAGGFYRDASNHVQAFVVKEHDGQWGRAKEVPGTSALNDGDAEVVSVSCAAAGACAVGGFYTDVADHFKAFLVSERHGRWGKAFAVPGLATLNGGPDAEVYSVACAAVGECAAGGVYTGRGGHSQAFVVSEIHGRWSHAIRVRGTVKLNRGFDARVQSVSCGAPGDCVAAGHYTDSFGSGQAFVENMRHGHWDWATEVPGSAGWESRYAEVSSVSCVAAGECAGGGHYGAADLRAFVVSEHNGQWRRALTVPGTRTFKGSNAQVNSVSCAAAGECVAGGYYTKPAPALQGFVVNMKHGRWGHAVDVPGLAALNVAGDAEVFSVSCGAVGWCVAGGRFTGADGYRAWVATERHGRWGDAIEVPGMATLNDGDAQVNAISCRGLDSCAAGGYYNRGAAWVVSRGR